MKLAIAVLSLALTPLALVAQAPQREHEDPQGRPEAPAPGCLDRVRQATFALDRAAQDVEAGRQLNQPAAMRAATDQLQLSLAEAKQQLQQCFGGDDAQHQPTPVAGHEQHAPVPAASASSRQGEAQQIEDWLEGYDAAFIAKDLDKLATFYHPDVTIYEGAGVNNGWIDYRDRHLGPELKAFENLEFGHSNRHVHMLGDRAAYVISEYSIKARMKDRMLDNIGRETLVLEKQTDGSWKIRHSHTSGRARPAK